MDLDRLRHRATELGAETSYRDNEGHHFDADPEALARVVDLLEDDDGRTRTRRVPCVITGSPERLYVGPDVDDAHLVLTDGTTVDLAVSDEHISWEPLPLGSHHLVLTGRGVDEHATVVAAPDRMVRSAALAGGAGVFAPAYALWERDDPLPSFGHLAALTRQLAARDVGVLVTLPLYAGFLDEPFDPSPYSPASRLHWNEVYLDDGSLPVAPHDEIGELVDWRHLAQRRRRQLLEAATTIDGALAGRVSAWIADRPDVADYARFRATVTPDPSDAGHDSATIVRSHELAQFLADEQLRRIEADGSASLALDLPIGSHPNGYETWAHPDLFAPDMAVGAPPDMMFSEGQNWGFPPQMPGAAQRSGYDLWRRVVARAGEYASMLRIDHILGVHRLWWVPDGMAATRGVYVRYPRYEMMAVIAAEGARTNTTIVGEDLGTVPAELLELLDRWNVLGLYEEQMFMFDHDLREIPERSVAGMRTHDMPAFAALAGTHDLGPYRRRLEQSLGHHVPDDGVLDATLERLARSAAYLVVADLDDLVGQTAPHNEPGRVLATTWRRRLAEPTSSTLARPDVRRRLGTLTDRPR